MRWDGAICVRRLGVPSKGLYSTRRLAGGIWRALVKAMSINTQREMVGETGAISAAYFHREYLPCTGMEAD
jgi:hypothetical protein